jgi:hypothetical protein
METKEMRVFQDGNSWCFVLPDFINLQESPAVFLDEGNISMDSIWELLHGLNDGFELVE